MLKGSQNSFFASHKFWYYVIMFVFGAMFYTMVIANHYYYRTFAFDYGAYNFAFYDFSHFQVSPCPVYKVFYNHNFFAAKEHFSFTFLQDHFSFTLFFLIPVYWLLNWLTGSYTLLLIQVTLILCSGWAIYKLVSLKTGDVWLGLGALLYYYLLDGMYCSFTSDCNIAIICTCLVPLFLYFFEAKKFVAAGVIFIISILSREDIPLWFVFIFFMLMIWNRKEKKIIRLCLYGIGISVIYFILVFKVFIPSLNTSDHQYALFNYSALGGNPFEALTFILQHPIKTFEMLFQNQLNDRQYDGVKKEFYMVYLLSGGFVLFLRPQYFIWFIPVLAQKMLNDEPVRWSIELYYSRQIVILLPISVFIILSIIKNKRWQYASAIILCCAALAVTVAKMPHDARKMELGSRLKENVFDPKFFHADFDVEKINSLLATIPANARVSASGLLVSHLAQRPSIYHFPSVEDAEYIALFTFPDYFLITHEQYREQVCQTLFDPEWNVINNAGPFLLLKKEPNKLDVKKFVCDAENLAPDNWHFIASDGESINNGDTRNNEKARSGSFSIKLNATIPYGFTWMPKGISAGDIVQATVWRYSDSNIGVLVASAGKKFYVKTDSVLEKDDRGWEKLRLTFVVPDDTMNFRVYVLNNGISPVWFDDMDIVTIKRAGYLAPFLLNKK